MEQTVLPNKSEVKVMRRRLLQHDLQMYEAISGKAPGMPPGTRVQYRLPPTTRGRHWSPGVLASYLFHMSVPRLAVRVVSPEMAGWMRRLSGQAIDRLHEAQARLASARGHTMHQPVVTRVPMD